MENKTYHVYTLTCPVDNVVRYVGCTINPKTRLSAHISESRLATQRGMSNKKIEWIQWLANMNIKPILTVVFKTTNIETASEMESYIFHNRDVRYLLCSDPDKRRYNNQLRHESRKSDRLNKFIRELVSSGRISKKDIFISIYSKANFSFRTTGNRIDQKLSCRFSDQELKKICDYLTSCGIGLPCDLPYTVRDKAA